MKTIISIFCLLLLIAFSWTTTLTCPLGFYVNNGTCENCPAGSFCPGDEYESAKYPCEPGSYSLTGFSNCELCWPGFYSNRMEAKRCTLCPEDLVAPVYGMAACVPCPVGLCPAFANTQCEPCVGRR
jgi:hypothetical protein